MIDMIFIIAGLVILSAFLTLFAIDKQKKSNILQKNLDSMRQRFKSVVDIEEEANQSREKFNKEQNEYNEIILGIRSHISQIQSDYANKKSIYDSLLQKISALEEDLEFIHLEVYKPHFELSDSEAYKKKIQELKDRQKQIIKNKRACVCSSEWHVEGSRKKGEQMINRQIQLMLRAFNNESDSAILKVKWKNMTKMEERIKKAFSDINKLGDPVKTNLTIEYLDSKLAELYLTYEHQQRLYEEQEEQRNIREMMREEEKVSRELERAKKKAEQEEEMYQKALDQARRDWEEAEEADRKVLGAKITELEAQLEEAHQQKERALSQAQLTKRGHVYVISNVGSFGSDVYKIGMTRRLDPMDRIKELGDASVPFAFDVHAIIYSNNAPDIERTLHEKLTKHRLNLVNTRKEFFKVSLDEITKQVRACGFNIEFTKYAEAQQYRESVALRQQRNYQVEAKDGILEEFPAAI